MALKMARGSYIRSTKMVAIDDLEGAAVDALVKAAQTFDAGRGVPFKAYAGMVIKGKLLDLFDQQRKRPKWRPSFHALPLTGEFVDDEGIERQLQIPAPAAPLDPRTKTAARILTAALASLTPRQRQIIRMYYFAELNGKEGSEQLGLKWRPKWGGSFAVTKFHALRKMRVELAFHGVTKLEHIL